MSVENVNAGSVAVAQLDWKSQDTLGEYRYQKVKTSDSSLIQMKIGCQKSASISIGVALKSLSVTTR